MCSVYANTVIHYTVWIRFGGHSQQRKIALRVVIFLQCYLQTIYPLIQYKIGVPIGFHLIFHQIRINIYAVVFSRVLVINSQLVKAVIQFVFFLQQNGKFSFRR